MLVLEWRSIVMNNRGDEEAVGGKKEWLAVNTKGRVGRRFFNALCKINI